MPRVSFCTLGCKLNFAETSTLERDFLAHHYEVVPFGEPSDVTVINTCTVTAEAERQCRQIIRRAIRQNPKAFIIVTGCYAQLRPEAIARIEGVDVVLGAREKFHLFELIESFQKKEQTQVAVSCIDKLQEFGPAFSSTERTRAFLKIQDGCDYVCSFCTIPQARGRSRSQPIEATVAQAHQLAELGFKEIVLTGVNIGLYGQEFGKTLLDLLRALDRVDGIERYRISSIEPNLLTDELIAFVAESRAFMPHFHLPLQSGDNFVLGKMRRRYRRELYAERVARIQELLPESAIGVDVIVGFPAETPERFENTYRFLNELACAYLHVFTYSERPGTAAVEQLDRVGGQPIPKPERSRRNRMLQALSHKKRHAFYQAHQGQVRPVLWESAEKHGLMYGYTDNYIRVHRRFDPEHVGQIEPVRLGNFAPDGTLIAEEVTFRPLSFV